LIGFLPAKSVVSFGDHGKNNRKVLSLRESEIVGFVKVDEECDSGTTVKHNLFVKSGHCKVLVVEEVLDVGNDNVRVSSVAVCWYTGYQ
jgi:hypothetical protein